jgi:hypothetical protein
MGEGENLSICCICITRVVQVHYQGTFRTFFRRAFTFSRIFETSIEKITDKENLDIKISSKIYISKKGQRKET